MGRLVIVILLLNSSISLTQNLGGMRGFEKLDNNDYFLRCSTEEEAIHKRNVVMDFNNIDTLRLNYYRGDNPVAINYLKIDKLSNNIISSFIIKHEDMFDIWFVETEDKDTYFMDVVDKNGDIHQLVYRKP
jgi:hypothetical protein